jgi:autotransporter-associated beta strand protein
VSLLGDTTISSTDGGGTLNGAITSGAAGTQTLTLNTYQGTGLVLTRAIGGGSGTIALAKTQTGTTLSGVVTLSGANTYTGATTVSAGSLNIQNANALGSTAAGTSVSSGAALQIQGNITTAAEALTLNGTGVSMDGALRNISGNNNYAGLVTLASATRINADAGTLTLSNAGTITGAGFGLSVGGAGNATIASSIGTGTGTLTKDAAGMLTLSGANTYSGLTTVSAGVLNIQNADALGTTATGTTVSSGAALQIQGDITTAAEALTLNGTGVSATGALRNISGNNTYAGLVTLGTATRINSDAGILSLSNTGTITGSGLELSVGGAGNTTIASSIGTGTGTLTKDGAGTLTLSAANTYSGATTVSGGTLQIGNGSTTGSIATGSSITNNGTLIFNRSDTITQGTDFNSVISGGGAVTQSGSGTLVFTGANTFTGRTSVSAGSTLQIGNGGTTGSIATGSSITNNGTLVFNRSDTITSGTHFNSVISGTGAVTQSGSGTLVFTGANTFTGRTNDSEATTLQIGNGGTTGSIATGSSITNNGTLIFNRSDTITQGTHFNSVIGGTGAVTQSGSGTLVLTGANTYSGATTVSAGSLNIQNANALGSTAAGTTVTSGAALQIQGNITTAAEALTLNGAGVSATGALRNISGNNNYAGLVTLASAARINSDSGTLSLSNTGTITGAGFGLSVGGAGNTTIASSIGTDTGTLTKDGAGTLTLSGANTHSGDTSVSAGVVNIQNVNALGTTDAGTTVSSGAALQIQGNITTAAEALTLNGTGVSTDGALRNISGNNTYAGLVTLASATRINSDAGTLSLSNTGTITGAGLGLSVVGAGNTTIASSIGTGTGTLSKDGVGTLTLSGANTYSGATTVSAGTLQIGNGGTTGSLAAASSITNNATLVFNRSNTFTLNNVISGTGAVTQSGSGTLVLAGANTYSGATSISTGALNIQSANALGSTAAGTTVSSGAALQIQGDITTAAEALTLNGTGVSATGALRNISGNNTYAGLVTLGSAARINSDAGTLTLSNTGQITGAGFGLSVGGAGNTTIASVIGTGTGTLTKDGAGTLILLGANSYTGATTISAGTLQIGNGGTTGSFPWGSITNNGTLVFNRSDTYTVTVFNAISGTGAVTQSGSGTLVFSGAHTYTGATTVSAGSTLFINDTSISTSSSIINNGTSSFRGYNKVMTQGTDFNSVISGTGAMINSSGHMVLNGANTYTGLTTAIGGLTIQNADALGTTGAGTTVSSGAALQIQGDITTAAEALTLRGTGVSATGALRNISGNNSYAGLVTLATATRINSDAGTLTLSNAGTITGSGLGLSVGGAGNTTIASIIGAGTGTLTKDGVGTLTLTRANTYTGATTISSGTLDLNGAAGALTATNGVNINGGTLLLSGSATDRISNTASVTLGAETDSKLQLSGSVTETLGAVTLSSGVGKRVIDFGAGSGVLRLASLTAASPLSVQIWNWSGTTGIGGGTDQLIISSGSLGGSLSTSDISFYSDSGISLLTGATIFNATSRELLTQTPAAPTITISSSVSTLKAAETATLSFSLSVASTDFSSADVSATGGTLSNFSGSGTAYTATFTPTANSTANGVISVASGTFSDAAGSTNQDGGDANNTVTLTIDTAAPAAPVISTITDDVSPITGIVARDGSTNDTVLVIAGTAEANSTVTLRSGSTSLGTVTANGSGAWSFTTATLANGSTYSFNATATDAAGNVSAASTNYIVTVDTAAPTLLSSTPADGATDAGGSNNLVLNFSETVAAGSGLISLYQANGSLVESFDAASGVGSAGGSVAFSGSAVTINPFADLVRGSGNYLQVAPTAIRDSAGNLYAGISDATSLNFTTAAATVSVGSITVSESSLYAVVAVGLDAAISDTLSFTPTLLSGTASIGSDAGSTLQVFNGSSWVSAAAGVSLAAGSTSLLLRVAITNDSSLEGLETFQISTGAINAGAAALTNASGASGTVTIVDDGSSAQIFDQDTNSAAPLLRSADNDTPSIAVSSVIVSEASPYAVLELSLTNPSNFAVSFTPSLQSGSAGIGVDTGSSLEEFNGSTWQAADQISMAAGVTSRLVRVAITNDSGYENSETFTISTGAISGPIANPAGASGTVTIRDNGSSSNTFLANNTSATPTAGSADNDTPVLPALSAAVLGNGNESGPLATSFRISRTGSTSSAMVATYRFAGSAIAGSDYTNPAGFDASTGLGSITIAAGQSSVDLNIASLNDSAVDGNRSLSLTLQSSLNYSLAAATATATILDNDVAPPLTPTFAISSASVVETDLGSNPLVNLIVSLSGPAATSVSVHVRTLAASSGSSATGTSASGGGDYVAISDQLLTFLPGSTSKLLPVQLLGDNTIEATESFRVELFNASGANLPAAAATIEIVDNDSGKSLSINNSAATTSQTFSGGQYADILIGGSAADTINGDPAGLIGGGDAITGNGGADILTGGAGPDRFRYLSFSDSTLNSTDRIRDLTLTGSDQDRIALAALPSALWNTGAITPASATLASAAAAAFADKNVLTAGNQVLAAGEAVLFAYDSTPGNSRTRQWFVAVNDSSAAFSSSNDLLINVTGLSSSFASGSLTPGLLFATH